MRIIKNEHFICAKRTKTVNQNQQNDEIKKILKILLIVFDWYCKIKSIRNEQILYFE